MKRSQNAVCLDGVSRKPEELLIPKKWRMINNDFGLIIVNRIRARRLLNKLSKGSSEWTRTPFGPAPYGRSPSGRTAYNPPVRGSSPIRIRIRLGYILLTAAS